MHSTELKVRFSELDPYGHVNHAVYLNYLEIGRIEALDRAFPGMDPGRRVSRPRRRGARCLPAAGQAR